MQPDPTSDLEIEIDLIRRIGQGDRQSFESFYDRVLGTLFSVANRVLNNREAAEDVLQDVFIQIWEKAPLYDPSRGKPITWAMTLVRNKAIDRLRSLQRRARLREDLQRESETLEQADDRTSFDAAATGEAGQLLRGALLQLTSDQREALELAFFGSMSQSEIAIRLGEPLGTIKARIRRGLVKLRELMAARM
jgi:RNA polymerase sigma-70 factor (ECF subfamily)